MSEKVDDVLRFLADGQWHDYHEVGEALRIPEEQVAEIVRFLGRFGFVEVDEATPSARAASETRKFLREVELQEATPRVLLVRGQIESVQATTTELRLSGKNLEVEWREASPHDEIEVRHMLEAWDHLQDGEWHNIADIAEKLGLSPEATQHVLESLRQIGFAVMHERWGKVRASHLRIREGNIR